MGVFNRFSPIAPETVRELESEGYNCSKIGGASYLFQVYGSRSQNGEKFMGLLSAQGDRARMKVDISSEREEKLNSIVSKHELPEVWKEKHSASN